MLPLLLLLIRCCYRCVLLQVWDTAGQCRFHRITHTYYRGSHGILLVYDMSEPSTLENIAYWMHNIQTHAASGVHTCLVGNKRDLCSTNDTNTDSSTTTTTSSSSPNSSSRDGTATPTGDPPPPETGGNSPPGGAFGGETGKSIADRYGVAFFETSAKTGHNVTEAFMSLVTSVQSAMAAEALAAKPPTPQGGRKSRRKAAGVCCYYCY
jgi:GTPase SAR1 family protein